MNTLIIQLQLEHYRPLSIEAINDLQEATRKFVKVLEAFGYARAQFCINEKVLPL